MILYLSDFDQTGSGYKSIGVNLVNDLVTRLDQEVLCLGLNYDGREHPWPYRILPVEQVGHVEQIISLMMKADEQIETIVVAMDLMLQEPLIERIKGAFPTLSYVALFPMEAGPLCQPWGVRLMQADSRLIMSKFGLKEMELLGVDGHYIPIGVNNLNLWRPPTAEERVNIRRGLNLEEDSFVVLTVADNQERKNLSAAADILSRYSVDIDSYSAAGIPVGITERNRINWIVVTRIGSPVGWKLDDLGMRRGILGRMMQLERGMPEDRLWMLFAAADVFLLTSKAEGLAIPVMEAMATKLPVVGTNCSAIAEHLVEGRGLLVDYEFKYTDPYGNGWRYFASVEHGAQQLERLATMPADERQAMVDAGRAYIEARNWQTCGDVLLAAIEEAKSHYQAAAPDPPLPETVYA